MPRAVSDAGPLIHLAQIGRLHLLKSVFGRVSVTPGVEKEVVDEGIRLGRADAPAVKDAVEEGWLVVEDLPRAMDLAAERLAEGENVSRSDAETLLLAEDSGVETVLVDEKALSDLARMYGLRVWNTWTILLEGLSEGFVELSDIESAIDELGRRRHKLRRDQADEILEAAELIASRRGERS